MWKVVAVLLIAGSQTACSAMNSHATAARQLRYGGPGPVLYCWRRELGNYSGPCIEQGLDKDLWSCAHKLAAVGKMLQETRLSRSEIIDCMHQKGWQELEAWVSG